MASYESSRNVSPVKQREAAGAGDFSARMPHEDYTQYE